MSAGRMVAAAAGLAVVVSAGDKAPGLIVLAVLVAVVVVVRAGGRGSAGRGVSVGHSHGGRRGLIARHEAGHYRTARALGYRGVTAQVWDGGGVTYSRSDTGDPVDAIAVARAGQYAAGSRAGCAGDDDLVRGILRGVPRDQRARVRRDGETLARRTVRRHDGAIRRDAERIEHTGRLG